MKKNNFTFIFLGGSFLLFILFTILLKFVDVKVIGPLGTSIGLAFLNKPFMMDINKTFDLASDLILIVSILLILVCAVLGLVQLVKKRHLLKVDTNILAIPLTLVVMALFIVFFEIVVINQRPVLIDGELEASYPSTHTTIIFTTLLITIPVLNNMINNKYGKYALFTCYLLLAILALVFRVLSGMHYFTDILGGILLAVTLGATNKSFTIVLDKFHKE